MGTHYTRVIEMYAGKKGTIYLLTTVFLHSLQLIPIGKEGQGASTSAVASETARVQTEAIRP